MPDTPVYAEVVELPPEPSDVEVKITQTRIEVTWDSPLEGDDGDDGTEDDGTTTDEEIAYFQVQLATDAAFTNIIRKDRMVRGHTKGWRVSKPSKTDPYYARVRSVDELGNKSAWVSSDDTDAVVTAPVFPGITFKRQGSSDKLKAIVTSENVVFAEEDISRYQFQLREVEFTKLDGDIGAGTTSIDIRDYDADEVPSTPFDAFIQDEDVSVTSIGAGPHLTWTVTRGVNSTTAATHDDGKRVYYFGQGTKADNQKVEEEEGSSETKAIFRGCEPKVRYTARVRAIDAQNRRSEWSDWSPIIKAAAGASTGGPGEDDPTEGDEDVTPYDWPYERVVRFIVSASEGTESDPFVGIDATITAARVEVTGAPTTDATFDVNVEGVSVLTVTVAADALLSDLTWVDSPGMIGQQTGAGLHSDEAITVTQTDLNGITGTITVYVNVYLDDGS